MSVGEIDGGERRRERIVKGKRRRKRSGKR
jgi:hypothetical protein